MKLKCIGGNADGKLQEVDSYFKVGDVVNVMATVEFKIADFDEDLAAFREGRTPDSMTVPYHPYRITVLHFSKDDTVKFLVPHNWTDKEAIFFQFGK